jgi:hypothetical protein
MNDSSVLQSSLASKGELRSSKVTKTILEYLTIHFPSSSVSLTNASDLEWLCIRLASKLFPVVDAVLEARLHAQQSRDG